MTTTNEEYGMEELMALAQAIQESQKIENEKDEQVVDASQVQQETSKEIDLTPRQEEMVEDIFDALQNIANMSDDEIKKLYKQFKVKYYVDKDHKEYFKDLKKSAKHMVKSDKKYRAVKYLGIASSVGALVWGIKRSIDFDGIGMMFWPQGTGQSTVDYVFELIQGNVSAYRYFVPEADALVCAFALGCVLYAGGKYLVRKDEMNKMRRLVVQELSQNLTEEELENLVKALKNNESLKNLAVESKQNAEKEQKQVADKKAKVDEGMER